MIKYTYLIFLLVNLTALKKTKVKVVTQNLEGAFNMSLHSVKLQQAKIY